MSETLTPRPGRSSGIAGSRRRQAPPDLQLGLFDDELAAPGVVADPGGSEVTKPMPIPANPSSDDAQKPEQAQTLELVATYVAIGAIETARKSAA